MTEAPRAARSSPRLDSPSLLLLGASLCLVAIAIGLAVRSAWLARANTRQLLGDYASFAAWSYSRHLSEALGESAWYTLNPIQHQAPHRSRDIPSAADLGRYLSSSLARCECDPAARPATYFRLSLATDSLETAGPSLARPVTATMSAAVRAAVRAEGPVRRNGMLLLPGTHQIAAFGLMPTVWGDTIVYGFTFDSAGLVAGFDRVFRESALLPATVSAGRPNPSFLALEIRDTTGTVLHRSAGWPAEEEEWPYMAEEWLPHVRGGIVARVTLIPAAAAAVLAGGLPRTPLPLLLLIGGLGIGSALVAMKQIRRAAELARLRSGFVSGVSHELRTPLAQIRLFLDTLRLKRYDTAEEQEWLIGHLVRETTRLEHLVENVLAAGRLEHGVASGAPLEPLDLTSEARDAVEAFRPLAASRQATLQLETSDRPRVRADRGRLRQLLLNLLDNAVKFGPPGQRIDVQITRESDTARLVVRDQGPGVPPAERQRIFEPHYRGSGPATAAVGGSGIGLSIVREVARQMNGEVHVQSAPEGGAMFVLELPLAHGDGEST